MKILIFLLCISIFVVPVCALEFEAPPVPDSGKKWMPEHIDSFNEALEELLHKVIHTLQPDLQDASRTSIGILCVGMLVSLLQSVSVRSKNIIESMGTVAVASLLFLNTNSLICLAFDTVREITDYGKLLLPVMTAALAAQGGISGSAALYTGTAAFIALMQTIMNKFLVPGVYLLLALYMGECVTGEDFLKRIADQLKRLLIWSLKIHLMVFTSYMSLTGVISGTTDAAALKATKVTFSSFVPVVGSILSDAAESVLISVGLMKNAAGIYGILAVLALVIHPFLQIGVHYLILKIIGGICASFGNSKISGIVDAFCAAMGIMLAITAAACVMILISTICYMKGIS